MDPYAKVIGGRDVWGETPDWDQRPTNIAPASCRTISIWEDDRPLEIPIEDLVIYEAARPQLHATRLVERQASRHLRRACAKRFPISSRSASIASS